VLLFEAFFHLKYSGFMKNTFLAIDLGAGSGRAMLGELTDGILSLQEIHRFANDPVFDNGHGYWDIELLFQEIKKSLSIVADRNLPVESIGIDTWGVDFSLMGDDGIPTQPFIYRDVKNDGMVETFTQRMSVEKVYGQTGIQISQINSLFQLVALKQMESESLKKAKHLLFMPDIFNYLLTGIIQTEFSIASTSQLYNPVKGIWDRDIFQKLEIPVGIMPRIVDSGSIIGSVSNHISYETGIARIPVVAVASHDTGSAVAAIPASGNNWVYISTGSWCLMGFESTRPIINKKSQKLNFTNEGGAGHTFRILKNLTGLWHIQECRKAWKGSNYSFEEMVSLASSAKPFTAYIDTDHTSFLHPENMPDAIQEYCNSTGQQVALTHGEIIRTIIEGLALKFRVVNREIEELRGAKPEVIHMTGGGIRNLLLCQFTADCCGIPVITSLDEAAAAGNAMLQAMALGIVKSVDEIREVTAKSFPSTRYEPQDTEVWDAAYQRYVKIVSQE
jgi:rhamnulokinase